MIISVGKRESIKSDRNIAALFKYATVNAPPIILLRAHKGSLVGVSHSSNRECQTRTTSCTQWQ